MNTWTNKAFQNDWVNKPEIAGTKTERSNMKIAVISAVTWAVMWVLAANPVIRDQTTSLEELWGSDFTDYVEETLWTSINSITVEQKIVGWNDYYNTDNGPMSLKKVNQTWDFFSTFPPERIEITNIPGKEGKKYEFYYDGEGKYSHKVVDL